jgi:hypothetical protein
MAADPQVGSGNSRTGDSRARRPPSESHNAVRWNATRWKAPMAVSAPTLIAAPTGLDAQI